MANSKLAKYLKYAIWVVLGLIVLIPIYIDSNFFFPYIFSKALAFRVLVEVLVALWLAYLWADKEKKIKIDWTTIIFLVMIVFMFVSAIFGLDFYRSFWSIMERSEGILLWLHMFAFFVVLRNFISSDKAKSALLDIFLLAAQVVAVIGLLQYIGVDYINKTGISDGGRIQSTIGNAAYLAGYMLFAASFACYLFVKRQNIYLKIYYVIAALFDVFVMLQTGTRGAFLGLLVSIFIFIIYNIFRVSSKKIKTYFLLLILLFSVAIVFVYQNKNASWVKNNMPLQRISSISLSERTAQTRLMAWEAAWQGFKERPILGYGAENYYVVFNKYFNPKIYSHAGSRIWFDRAHNIFLDHLINGGLIELILYIMFLGLPTWWLLKKGILTKDEDGKLKNNWDKQILFLSITAFVVQGMVVFEAMVTYLPLLIIMAFIIDSYGKVIKEWKHKEIILGIFITYLVALIPIMYFVNIREEKANGTLIKALRLQNISIENSYNTYIEAIDMHSSGTNEFYRRLTEFVDGLVINQAISPYQALTYSEKVDSYLQHRIDTVPQDTANYLLYMRHLNYTYALDIQRLYKVKELGKEAIKYSPTRPHIYYEIGYADLYIYQKLKNDGKLDEASKYQSDLVYNFQKAIDLNPEVEESYLNMIMSLLASDQPEKVESYLTIMDGIGIDYSHDEDALLRLSNSAVHGGYFDWAAFFFNKLVELNPQNPDYYTSLALSYANAGENDKAIVVAEEVKKFGEPYSSQVEQFIQNVKNGTYKNTQ